MPNWCENQLTISGTENQMREFYKRVDEYDNESFLMNNFVPMPEEIRNTVSPAKFYPVKDSDKNKQGQTQEEFELHNAMLIAKYGFNNWYDWSVHNWGTKWDININGNPFMDKTTCTIFYDTAWSPNIAFVIKLAKMFPDLTFNLEYKEGGCAFAGKLYCKGDEVDATELTYHAVPVKYIEEADMIHFITPDEDSCEADEWFDVIGGNLNKFFDECGYSSYDFDNYNELEKYVNS